MSEIVDLLETLTPFVAIPILIISAVTFYINVVRKHSFDRIVGDLDSPAGRIEVKNALACEKRRDVYSNQMQALDSWMDGFFGPVFSWRAYDQALKICLGYPIALFLMAWLFGASGELADTALLPEAELPTRLVLASVIILSAGVYWLLFNGLDKVQAIILSGLIRSFEYLTRKSTTERQRNALSVPVPVP
ncbi:MAG: hypothetical protein AAF141_16345, partial [Pseudomonadota bacterium]